MASITTRDLEAIEIARIYAEFLKDKIKIDKMLLNRLGSTCSGGFVPPSFEANVFRSMRRRSSLQGQALNGACRRLQM